MKRDFHKLVLALAVIAGSAHLTMASAAGAANPWDRLPPTPKPLVGGHHGHVAVDGARLYYAEHGRGDPVILLHGGPANSRSGLREAIR